MGNVSWAHGGGWLAPWADGYGDELARLGFTRNSGITHVVLMGQLSRWMSEVGIVVGDLTEGRVERFFDSRRARGQRRVPTARTLAPLFVYLRSQGVVTPPEAVAATPLEDLLACYRRHLVDDRGLAPSTVTGLEERARLFLSERMSARGGGTGVQGLCAGDVTRYLLRECSRLGVGSAKNRVTELRSLLRFLYLQGLIGSDLAAAVPPVAGWRDTALPSTLAASEVAALLSSCDRSKLTGRRDFAILTLLARLGLRSCEVAGLELDDIDWRAGELRVRGKGRSQGCLPLLSEVGECLASYLRDGRPRAESRRVFLTSLAPLRGLHPASIGSVVGRACERVGRPVVGPHRLRHALAAEMFRQGATLPQIGQVLRHRDLATTAVYAKVDLGALRRVAQPWPGAGQ
jgi:site-specific recombinase XerD